VRRALVVLLVVGATTGVGARACALSGFVRVAFSGNYGFTQSKKPA